MTLRVRCHAKLNLFLKIYGKRPDGYHDIVSVMQSVDLADILFLDIVEREGITIACTDPQAPTDQTNLAWMAAEMLSEESGMPLGGLQITIEKDIPVMAGLAGGSADAAGALAGLRKLWAPDLDDSVLFDVAAKLGSDVPFCLLGGTALASGRGEILGPFPEGLADRSPDTGAFLVVMPPLRVDTRSAYDALDLSREKEARKWDNLREEYERVRMGWQTAIADGSFPTYLHNDFESPVLGAYPELAAVHTHLRNVAGNALLSGSGSSMFAYFPLVADAHAAWESYTPVAGELALVALPVPTGVSLDE